MEQNFRSATRKTLRQKRFAKSFERLIPDAPIEVKLPKTTVGKLSSAKVQQISLIWEGWLKLAIVIDDGKAKEPVVQSDKYCGVDLGEIHSISAFESGCKALIVTGRKLRSVKQYQLKKLAEFDSKLSKSKRDSRRNKKLRRAKRRMFEKTNAQIIALLMKVKYQSNKCS